MSTPTTGRVASMYRHRCGGHSSTRCAASGTMSCSWSCPQTIMNMEQMTLLSAYAASRGGSADAHIQPLSPNSKNGTRANMCVDTTTTEYKHPLTHQYHSARHTSELRHQPTLGYPPTV